MDKVYIVCGGWFGTPICVCESMAKAERYIAERDPEDKYMHTIEEVPFHYARTLDAWERKDG